MCPEKLYVKAIVVAALCLTTSAYAQSPTNAQGKSFQELKQKELDNIARHLNTIQTLQSCVQAAQNHEAIKTCNETAKAAMRPPK